MAFLAYETVVLQSTADEGTLFFPFLFLSPAYILSSAITQQT
jgi:hypothetical protein